MTVQNNHFSTQLPHVNRPTAAEKPGARGTASTAATTAPAEKEGAAQTSAPPVGLVGNHVNTTA